MFASDLFGRREGLQLITAFENAKRFLLRNANSRPESIIRDTEYILVYPVSYQYPAALSS